MKFYIIYIDDNIYVYIFFTHTKIITFIIASQQRVLSLQSQLSVHPFFDAR